jgi:N-ethylmaleimide reductase
MGVEAETHKQLFTPLDIGSVVLPHRVIMPPMTRHRAVEPGGIPGDLMRRHYAERSGAGLIITEATSVSPMAHGYGGTPGIHTPAQVEGWSRVVRSVHGHGGRIALQLWHVGRVSHESLIGGRVPVAPSSQHHRARTTLVTLDDTLARVPCTPARALTVDEIHGVVDSFATAARIARDVGFDLVEIHGAHGYLLHQFQSAGANIRNDEYGGSLARRARLTSEVLVAASEAWAPERIGLRLSPCGVYNDVDDHGGLAMTLHLAGKAQQLGLAYLHVSEADWIGGPRLPLEFRARLRHAYHGPIIVTGGYNVVSAEAAIASGHVDAVGFGRLHTANPDLADRLRPGARGARFEHVLRARSGRVRQPVTPMRAPFEDRHPDVEQGPARAAPWRAGGVFLISRSPCARDEGLSTGA